MKVNISNEESQWAWIIMLSLFCIMLAFFDCKYRNLNNQRFEAVWEALNNHREIEKENIIEGYRQKWQEENKK